MIYKITQGKAEKSKGDLFMKENILPLNLQFFADGEELGENETDTAEQSEVTTEEQTTETETSEQQETEQQDVTPPTSVQSTEDNAKFAAARRQAEREFQAKQSQVDNYYATKFAGYTNPLTNQPIRSEQDYRDALDAQEVVKQRQELQSKGIDPDMLSQIVNQQVENNPVVRQAQEVMQRTINDQSNQMITEDLKEIMRIDPSVKSVDDIAKLPNVSQILSLTQTGMRFSDAYKVANMDSLINNKAGAAKQAAINNIKGTQHLNATNNINSASDSSVDIPSSELTNWQDAYPNLSMAELKKKYNQTL